MTLEMVSYLKQEFGFFFLILVLGTGTLLAPSYGFPLLVNAQFNIS